MVSDGLSRHWFGLTAVFVLLSIDESVSIHERAGSALGSLMDTGGLLYYIWVIPGFLFAASVAMSSRRLLAGLSPSTRQLFLVSGVGFVACAVGLEALAAPEAEQFGTDSVRSILFVTVEESGEMLFLSLFLYALLAHLASTRITVEIKGEESQA